MSFLYAIGHIHRLNIRSEIAIIYGWIQWIQSDQDDIKRCGEDFLIHLQLIFTTLLYHLPLQM